jgi:uncharacterized protein YggE
MVLTLGLFLCCMTSGRVLDGQTGAISTVEERPALALADPYPSLVVSGHGSVFADPDLAWVLLGAEAQAPDATAAQNQVNLAVQTAIEAIRAQNVAAEHIVTLGLTLEPVYASDPVQPGEPAAEPRIVGYRASNLLRVRLTELERIGAIVDAGLRARTNRLQGIEFGLSDDLEFRQEALRQAVKQAQAKASALASALGVRLEAVQEITENDVRGGPEPFRARAFMAEAIATPIMPGEIEVQSTVTLRYRISATNEREESAPMR